MSHGQCCVLREKALAARKRARIRADEREVFERRHHRLDPVDFVQVDCHRVASRARRGTSSPRERGWQTRVGSAWRTDLPNRPSRSRFAYPCSRGARPPRAGRTRPRRRSRRRPTRTSTSASDSFRRLLSRKLTLRCAVTPRACSKQDSEPLLRVCWRGGVGRLADMPAGDASRVPSTAGRIAAQDVFRTRVGSAGPSPSLINGRRRTRSRPVISGLLLRRSSEPQGEVLDERLRRPDRGGRWRARGRPHGGEPPAVRASAHGAPTMTSPSTRLRAAAPRAVRTRGSELASSCRAWVESVGRGDEQVDSGVAQRDCRRPSNPTEVSNAAICRSAGKRSGEQPPYLWQLSRPPKERVVEFRVGRE